MTTSVGAIARDKLKFRVELFSEADELVGECIWGSHTGLASVGTLQALLGTWDLFLLEILKHSASSKKL